MKNFRPSSRDHDSNLARIFAWTRVNEVRCQADDQAGELRIFGPIGESMFFETVTVSQVADELAAFPPGVPVNVLVNSPGGDAFDGVAIYNLLRMAPNDITITVLGLAASAASVVSMAGDTIAMAPGSTMMIHKAWTIAIGNENDMMESAGLLKKVDANLVDIYQRRTGIKEDAIADMMDPETWMTAKEAVDQGFADKITDIKQTQPAATEPAQPSAMSRTFGVTA